MSPSFNLPIIVSVLGAAQALLLAVALVSLKRGHRTANRLLAAFAFTIAVMIGGNILITTHYIDLYPHLSRVHHPFDFLAAPLLYLYIRTLLTRKNLEKRDWLHFAPFVLCALYLIPYYAHTSEYKLDNFNSLEYARWYYLRAAFALPLAAGYLTCVVLLLVKFSRKVQRESSPAEKAILFQARFMVISFLALLVVAILRYLVDVSLPAYMGYTNLVLPLGATVIVYTMAYFGLRRSEWPEMDDLPSAKKYERSNLTPDRSERYLKRLLDVMATEKPYTDGELTLQKLAERLKVPAPHLSQTINERMNQSFTEFINTYRVEEAKRQLLDSRKKHCSILAIAEDVGFNSKSAFNAVFKKYTNTTPSEFRKAANGNGAS
ncbi:MAG TPA: helix-turn-helix domain-containing protein [Pyrinomonadaceae bacterium]|nr:helix-turn-helix domain-containing protein [Pyrinomonadaceae bacterium]